MREDSSLKISVSFVLPELSDLFVLELELSFTEALPPSIYSILSKSELCSISCGNCELFVLPSEEVFRSLSLSRCRFCFLCCHGGSYACSFRLLSYHFPLNEQWPHIVYNTEELSSVHRFEREKEQLYIIIADIFLKVFYKEFFLK